jgi:hypothetical protein
MLARVSGSGKKGPSDDEPPYAKYAFLNPYNLSLLVGTTVTAAATGHWWLAVCAAATEGLWMVFAPDSKVLQRAWFDKTWARTKRAELEEAQDQKIAKLWPNDVVRFRLLREQKTRIEKLANDNPSLTVDLMSSELEKIDGLLEDFLELALVCARSEQHLQSFDFKALQRTWQQYSAQLEHYPAGDRRREVAEKNLEVLGKRRQRYEELRRIIETSRGQMDLMENTFRLLVDDILTMANPEELGLRLDDLRVGVDAIRETTTGQDDLYEELEIAEEGEAEQQRRAR